MPSQLRKALRPNSLAAAACAAGWLALAYLYTWLWVDPSLIYHRQAPVFYVGWAFFAQAVADPGELVVYVSGWLSQGCFHGWLGAAVITAAIALTNLAALAYLRAIGGPRAGYLAFLPGICLLALHGEYSYPLALTVAAMLAASAAAGWAWLPVRRAVPRAAVLVAASAALYYAAGGAMLWFLALCAVHELAARRRWVTGGLCVILALLLPYVAGWWLFDLPMSVAYLRLLAFARWCVFEVEDVDTHLRILFFWPGLGAKVASIALYASIPVCGAALALRRPLGRAARVLGRRLRLLPRGAASGAPPAEAGGTGRARLARRAAAPAAVLLVSLAVAAAACRSQEKAAIRIDRFAARRQWPEVLEAAGALTDWDTHVRHDVNRALHHTGRMGEEMFAYPQAADLPGLLNPAHGIGATKSTPTFLKLGELYVDLGRVNMAEKAAHEAWILSGESPRVLRALALINVIKRQPETARFYLRALRRSPLDRRWARRMLRALDADAALSDDEGVRRARSRMIRSDVICVAMAEMVIGPLLRENRRNRMAFEYLMAHYLLRGNLGGIAANIGRLADFNYAGIPRHYEEAALLYMRSGPGRTCDLGGRRISAETIERLRSFREILARHGRDRDKAHDELNRAHGDSYFFYYTYGRSGTGRHLREPRVVQVGRRR